MLDQEPGTTCGDCGSIVCDGIDALRCDDPGFNECGTCGPVPDGGCADGGQDDGGIDDGGADTGDLETGEGGAAAVLSSQARRPSNFLPRSCCWESCGTGGLPSGALGEERSAFPGACDSAGMLTSSEILERRGKR